MQTLTIFTESELKEANLLTNGGLQLFISKELQDFDFKNISWRKKITDIIINDDGSMRLSIISKMKENIKSSKLDIVNLKERVKDYEKKLELEKHSLKELEKETLVDFITS